MKERRPHRVSPWDTTPAMPPIPEPKVSTVDSDDLPKPDREMPSVHFWPDGAPESHLKLHRWTTTIWCGIRVGTSFNHGEPQQLSYHWTRNPEKVTCKICKNKMRIIMSGKTEFGNPGVVEVI